MFYLRWTAACASLVWAIWFLPFVLVAGNNMSHRSCGRGHFSQQAMNSSMSFSWRASPPSMYTSVTLKLCKGCFHLIHGRIVKFCLYGLLWNLTDDFFLDLTFVSEESTVMLRPTMQDDLLVCEKHVII